MTLKLGLVMHPTLMPPFDRVQLSRIFVYPASVSEAHFCYHKVLAYA
jgi:hypothetical protein